MPVRYIPVSEDEQKFAALVDRVFTDQHFAKSMQETPAAALEKAGYSLTAAQKQTLATAHAAHVTIPQAEGSLAFPLVRPVVSVITRGTRPVVSVVTKGTQPVVSVAVNTILAVEAAATHPELEVVAEEKRLTRGAAAK